MTSARGLWLVFGCTLASLATANVGPAGETEHTTAPAPVVQGDQCASAACAGSAPFDPSATATANALADLGARFGGDSLRFALELGRRHAEALAAQRLERSLQTQRANVQALPPVGDRLPLLAASNAPVTTGAARLPMPSDVERVYVTNERSGELSVLDPVLREVRAKVPLGKRPRGLALSPDGRHLYIALSGSPIGPPKADSAQLPLPDKSADGIGVVDVATLRLVRTLRGVSDPEQLAVSRDGRKLYVASEDTATAVVLDAHTGAVRATLTVGREPEGVGISPDGHWVYVSSEADDQVAVIDTQIDAVVATIATCARPRGIVFGRTTARAYVSCENSAEVAVIDALRHREIARIPVPGLGARPMGVVLSPDERVLYVATGRGGTLVALSTLRHHRVLASTSVGQRPWGVSISADGRRLYTANGPSNDLAIVDAGSMKVIERVAVGTGPWGALVQEGSAPASPAYEASPPRSDPRPELSLHEDETGKETMR